MNRAETSGSSRLGPRAASSAAAVALLGGAASLALVCWIVARVVAPHIGIPGWLFWPLVGAEAFAAVRLGLLTLLSRSPRSAANVPPAGDLALDHVVDRSADVDVAVIVVDEDGHATRTAVLAALATLDAARVMLVGPCEIVEPLAHEFGIRSETSDATWASGVRAAVGACAATHLALTSASSALVPAALDQVGGDDRCGWVQTETVAPEARSLLQHLHKLRLDPTIDQWRAAPWTGAGSIVRVAAFRDVDLAGGPLATTIALQRAGWHGRVGSLALVIDQSDRSLVVAQRESTRSAAGRLRVLRTRNSPLWTSGPTLRQRIVHVHTILDDLAGTVTAVVLAVVAAAIVVGRVPVQHSWTMLGIGVAVYALASVARAAISHGLLRPGSLANQDAERIDESVAAVWTSALGRLGRSRAQRGTVLVGRRALVHRSVATTIAATLEVALVARAVSTVFGRGLPDTTKATDLVVLAIGVVAVVPVLISLRILVRNRQLRVSRRTEASVPVTLDGVAARIVDLGSRGMGVESAEPMRVGAETTATIFAAATAAAASGTTADAPTANTARQLPIQVRLAVARCRANAAGWSIGLRVIEPAPSPAFDEFVVMWATIAAAGSVRPEPTPQLQRVRGATWLPARGGGNRLARLATAATMVFVGAANLPPYSTSSAAAVATINTFTLSTSAPATILYGTSAIYGLTACNTKSAPRYNLGLRDVLPKGATYVAGSGSPAPTRVLTDAATGKSTLLWENISDLQVNSCFSASYLVAHNSTRTDADTLHVGDVIVDNAEAYANIDPRYVPKFNSTTGVVLAANGGTQELASTSAKSTIVPITIDKNEPSPEDELVRGVHDHTTAYTLTIKNNTIKPTAATTVDDWLPAGLEFLGCGMTDNTPADVEEYPGAPRLDASSPDLVTDCLVPVLVETVAVDPDGAGSLSAGVYTHLRWATGDIAAGALRSITYRAGIPNRENELFAEPTPDASGVQGANLANNTGAWTTEPSGEKSYTNLATVAGTYTGVISTGVAATQTWSSDVETVSSEDLAIQKSGCNSSPADAQRSGAVGNGCLNGVVYDGLTTWNLTIETSEYRSSSDVVVTDVVGDGLVYVAGSSVLTSAGPTTATKQGSFEPRTLLSEDGTQSLEWTFGDLLTEAAPAAAMSTDAVYTITFTTRTLPEYRRTSRPVLSFDTLTNSVGITGTSDVVVGDDTSGQVRVADVSAASLRSSWGSISKKTLSGSAALNAPRRADSSSLGCAAGTTATTSDVTPRFTRNDVVCFELDVVFPTSIRVRDALLTDFIPPNTTYVGYAPYPDHQAGAELSTTKAGAIDQVQWTFGTDPSTTPRYTSGKGDTFHVVVAVRVADDPLANNNYDIVDNLMKVTTVATDGSSTSLRASDSYRVVEPELALYKGVIDITRGSASVSTYPRVAPTSVALDAHTVRQGDQVTFALVVPNVAPQFADGATPTSARLDSFGHQVGDATSVTVWDLLAPNLTCGDLVPAGGTNLTGTLQLRPGALPLAVVPTVTLSSIACSADRLSFVADRIPAGYQLRVDYTARVSPSAAAGVSSTNTAGVREYNDVGSSSKSYLPLSNIDPAVTAALANSPIARDNARVALTAASVAKGLVTSITEANNSAATQATIGEKVTYTVTVTVPAGTSVYDAIVTDDLVANLDYTEGSVAVIASPAATQSGGGAFGLSDAPSGHSLTESANGWKLTLPTTTSGYRNDTPYDQKFVVSYVAVVKNLPATLNAHGKSILNTAALTWKTSHDGTTVATPTNAKSVVVVEPLPTITKSHAPAGPFAGNDVVTYTVTPANTTGRSPLHDVVVNDCAPAGLASITPKAMTAPSTVTVAPVGSCAAGGTLITWVLAGLEAAPAPGLQPGAQMPLTYTAAIVAPVAPDRGFVNKAVVTGTSISGTDAGERTTYTAGTQDEIRTKKPTLSKAVSPTVLTNGQVATYTLVSTLPPQLTAYDATIVDQLPANLVFDQYGSFAAANYSGGCAVAGAAGHTISRNGQTIGWFLGDVTSGASPCVVTLTYTGHVGKAAVDTNTLQNTATLSWNVTDGRADDIDVLTATYDRSITARAAITVAEPRLTIVKVVDDVDRLVDGGQLVGYAITVTNTGTSAAYDITVSDALPTDLLTPAGTFGGDCPGAATPASSPPAITWTLFSAAAGLAPGAQCVLTYQQRVTSAVNLTDGRQLTNTASIPTFAGDPDRSGPGAADFKTYVGPSAAATVTGYKPTLAISKTTSANLKTGQAAIGQPFTWTVTVTNTSPVAPGGVRIAYGIDVVDTLPANWLYTATTSILGAAPCTTAATAPQTSTAGAVQTLTWSNLCNLAPGESVVVVYTANPQVAAATTPGLVNSYGAHVPHVNKAVLGAEDAGGNPLPSASDTATASLTSVDLKIVKTDAGPDNDASLDGAGFTIGETGYYYLTVSNAGPDATSGVITVSDALPAGLTLAAAPSGADWTCSVAQPFTCTHPGPLASGRNLPQITVPVDVDIAALNDADHDGDATTGLVTNSASVVGLDTDRNPTNNTDDESTPVRRMPNFAIDKVLDPATPFVPGTTVNYILTVANIGPSPATGPVTVTDPLPDGMSFVGAIGDGWDCTASVVGSGFSATNDDNGAASCTRTVAELAIGQLPPITVSVALDPSLTNDVAVVNVAQVSHPDDRDPSNDTNDESANPRPVAELTITKDDGGATFSVGQTDATYTIVVSNQGPSSEQGPVVVTDAVPAGLRLVTAEGPGWTCDVTAGTDFTSSTGSFSCNPTSADPVGPGSILGTITVTVEVGPNAITDPAPGAENLVTNTAGVVGVTDATPHTADEQTPVTPTAALTITKAHDAGTEPWKVGGAGSFRIIVGNDGPNGEYGPITVTDPFPAGLTLTSATGEGWACELLEGEGDGPSETVSCTFERPAELAPDAVLLAAGDELAPIEVDVEVGPAAVTSLLLGTNTIFNTATVTGTTDTTPHDAVDDVAVVPVVDLRIDKVHRGESFPVGERGVYDITVTNAGPSVAAGPIIVTDALPAGLTFVDGVGVDWSCAALGQAVTCTLASPLPVDAMSTLSITVDVGPAAFHGSDALTNTAEVHGPDEDAAPDNNSDDDDVAVEPLVGLTIDKSHTGDFRVGGTGSFALAVSNKGPNDHGAATITVVDVVPVGLTYRSAGGDGWTCTVAAATVTCDRPGPLAKGATAPPITVVVDVGVAAEQGVVNTATVASPERDADLANNQDSDSVTAVPVSDLGIHKALISPLLLGAQATWRITVANAGPSVAHAVTVVDDMPAGLTVLDASSTDGLCHVLAQVTSCLVGSMESGSRVGIDIVVRVDAIPSDGTYTNTATVASSSVDPNPADDTASATGVATAPAIVESAPPTPQAPGSSGVTLPTTGAAILGTLGAATAFALAGLLLLGVRRRPARERTS